MNSLPKTQKCFQCGKYKKLKEFGVDKRGKYGRKRQCYPCKRISSREYRERKVEECDLRFYAGRIYANMKRKHDLMGLDYDPEFSLDEIENIIANSKCEVSNRSFNPTNITKYRINPFMASPDRINNDVGY